MFKENKETIAINYETNNNYVSFNLAFAKGNDSSVYSDSYTRTNYDKKYNIEVFESDENKGYRILCDDSPFVVSISNINIEGNDNYDYALGFAVDNSNPEYKSEESIMPYNIERDGTMWTLETGRKEYKFDQNPNGLYQWQTKRACDIGYEPTEEEKELGMETTTEKTGLIYITFMLMYKEKTYSYNTTRGTTRGITRGATRGLRGSSEQYESDAGRFGYGNTATTNSVKSDYRYLPKTERYVLPMRIRISKDSENTDINCSNTLKGANVNELKMKTMVVPF